MICSKTSCLASSLLRCRWFSFSQGGICSFPGGYWSQMGRNQQIAFRLYTSLLSSIVWVQKMQASCFDTACATQDTLYPVSFCKMSTLEVCKASAPPNKVISWFQHPIGDGILVVFFRAPCGGILLSPEQYPPCIDDSPEFVLMVSWPVNLAPCKVPP